MKHGTVGSVLRSNQAYYSQICATESLEWGIAYWSEAFPAVAEANQFREVIVSDAAVMPQALAAATDFFTNRGLRCRRWAPAADQPIDAQRTFLESHGFEPRHTLAMRLEAWPAPLDVAGVRVLPARAMRAAFRETFAGDDAATIELANERLDDPSLDMLVAMVDNRPAGRCAFFEVGDIGRIVGLNVVESMRGRGVATALLSSALAVAHRVASRIVCAQVDAENGVARACFERIGFRQDGVIVEFDAVA